MANEGRDAKEFAKTFELPAGVTQADGDYLFAEAYAASRVRELDSEHEAGCRCEDGGGIGWKHHTLCSLRKLAWQRTQDATNEVRDSIELTAELARVRGLLQRQDDLWMGAICAECENGDRPYQLHGEWIHALSEDDVPCPAMPVFQIVQKLKAVSAETGGEKCPICGGEDGDHEVGALDGKRCPNERKLAESREPEKLNASHTKCTCTNEMGLRYRNAYHEKFCLAESSLSSPPESMDEPWRKAGSLYSQPPKRCPECDHDIFISAGPTKYECYICSLEREIEWLRKRSAASPELLPTQLEPDK